MACLSTCVMICDSSLACRLCDHLYHAGFVSEITNFNVCHISLWIGKGTASGDDLSSFFVWNSVGKLAISSNNICITEKPDM